MPKASLKEAIDSNARQNVMALVIDPLLCPQNHRCPMIPICPAGAISQKGNALPRSTPKSASNAANA